MKKMKKMKNVHLKKSRKLYRMGASAMCMAYISVTLAGCGAPDNRSTEETLSKILAEEVNVKALTDRYSGDGSNRKEETVYVFTDASGRQSSLTVNEKLSNGMALEKIEDITALQNIVNLSGDEISQAGEGEKLTWQADGNSITYQGSFEKQAPVEIKISYKLDGREIPPEELAGKSGHVTMRFDYINHQKSTIQVDGKEKEVTVPFTMITGILLPSDKFCNIETTNGKVSDIREDRLVLGITMPGLADSLKMDIGGEELYLNIPEYFEVSADVEHFELDMIMSVATSSLLADLNLEELSTDKLQGQMEELQDAADEIAGGTEGLQDGTKKLADGAVQLKDGISRLTQKVPELTDGVSRLDNGASELLNGSEKLASGTAQVSDGASRVSDGVSQLSSGAGNLSEGADKLFEGAGTLSQGADTLHNGADNLSQGADKVSEGAAKVSEGAETLKNGIKSYTEGVDQAAGGISELDTKMAVYAASMQQLYDALAKSETPLDVSIGALLSGASQIDGGSRQLKEELEAGMAQAQAQYEQAYNGFYQIAVNLTAVSGGTDAAGAASMLEACGLSSGADVTNQAQMAAATGFLLENYMTIIDMQAADQGTIITIISGLSQAYQAYGITSGTYASLNQSGYFDGISGLAGGLDALSRKIGSFSEEEEGTVCTSIAKLNEAAAQLKTQGTEALNAGLSQIAGKSGELREGSETLAKGASDLAGGASELADGTSDLALGASELAEGANGLYNGAGTLADGASELAGGASELADGASTLKNGAADLKNGAGSLKDGISSLKNGTRQLAGGAGVLASGANELLQGVTELSDGALSLNDGAITLKNGVAEFNQEGISKLSELAGKDAEEVVETLKKIVQLGKDYQSFAGKADDMDGSVFFIYKTEGISAES